MAAVCQTAVVAVTTEPPEHSPSVLGRSPSTLHLAERTWTETNCYVDLWIELIHALGLDPRAAGGCTLSADFDGEQWQFLKYPAEDLRILYGIEVAEMNIWRPVLDHVVDQLGRGRLLTVEVDSFWLPDTQGAAYRRAHVKTTVVPQAVDVDRRHLTYFHNAGVFELFGDDFDGVFGPPAGSSAFALPPYVELIRFDRLRDTTDLPARAAALAHEHLSRRPHDNPVVRLGAAVASAVAWLRESDIETFHLYAFGTLRQCGATAELAADFVQWLAQHGFGDLGRASSEFRSVAVSAKAAQFQLARAARGRAVDLTRSLRDMATTWDSAMAEMSAWHRLA